MTIEQLDNVVNIIDETRAPGEQIIGAIPLDWAVVPQARSPQSDRIIFKSSSDDNAIGVDVDGLLLKDINGIATPWVGTLDELVNKINDDYLVGYGGGGGSFPADYANSGLQTDLKNLSTAKSKEFYFNLSDIEVNTLTFPVTCTLTSISSAGTIQSVASATYNNLQELITAFNAGITYYQLEYRTEGSFYVLDGTEQVGRDNLTEYFQFNSGLGAGIRTFSFHRLNIGSYPAANLSSSDLILDENIAVNGTGRGEALVLVNPQNATFYNVKSIQVLVKAASDGEIQIKELSGTLLGTQAVTFPFSTAKGNSVEAFSKNYARVSKNPIVINNTGAATNEVVVSVLY